MNRDTLIVVGAGGSIPYNFPSGRKLVDDILGRHRVALLKDRKAVEYGHQIHDLERFCDALKGSLAPSVDAFLETRPELIPVGRMVIAYALTQHENESALYPTVDYGAGAWYDLLFDAMRSKNIADFGRRVRAIVTFNYDRSLEVAIRRAISDTYNPNPEELAIAVARVPVVHPYGSLGSLDEDSSGRSRPYAADMHPGVIKYAAECIRIVYEDIAGDDVFLGIHGLIAECNNIAFIGFGFNETNVRRLFAYHGTAEKGIYGTILGISDSRKRWELDRLFAGHAKHTDFQPVDARQFMLNNHNILYPPVDPIQSTT